MMAACATQAQKDMDRQRGRETDTGTYNLGCADNLSGIDKMFHI